MTDSSNSTGHVIEVLVGFRFLILITGVLSIGLAIFGAYVILTDPPVSADKFVKTDVVLESCQTPRRRAHIKCSANEQAYYIEYDMIPDPRRADHIAGELEGKSVTIWTESTSSRILGIESKILSIDPSEGEVWERRDHRVAYIFVAFTSVLGIACILAYGWLRLRAV